jgi:hypothetical protein
LSTSIYLFLCLQFLFTQNAGVSPAITLGLGLPVAVSPPVTQKSAVSPLPFDGELNRHLPYYFAIGVYLNRNSQKGEKNGHKPKNG